MYKRFFLQLFVFLFISAKAFGQPPIYTVEYITTLGPGLYETHYCDGDDKFLWTDSTTGYTSYLWSNGDTTPSITIPTTMPVNFADTMTLTVGLPMGGTATSTVYLEPSTLFLYALNLIPASVSGTFYCPGPMDFAFNGTGYLDSLVIINNDTLQAPFSSDCNIVNIVMPQLITATRILKNGCMITMTEWSSSPFNPAVQPTVIQNGNQLNVYHSFAVGSVGTNYNFYWYDLSGTQVGTGDQFSPTISGSYYAVYEQITYNGLWNNNGQCEGFQGASCYSVSTDTTNIQLVGLEDSESNSNAVVPNPNAGVFKLKNASQVEQVELIDLNGKKVASLRNASGGFDVSELPSGFYWLYWEDQNGPQHQSFIKQE